VDDLIADVYALIADIHARASDKLSHVVLRFTAKRTAKEFFGSPKVCHREIADNLGARQEIPAPFNLT